MATMTMTDKVNLIQFLDFLCTSIFMSSVPPTLLKSGATLMHLGGFMSFSAAVRMVSMKISVELMKISKKQEVLKYFLLISFILNIALFMTTSVTGILINRILYVVFNHVAIFSRQLINKDPNDRRIHEKPHIQMLAASLIASGIVGSLIDSKGGFYWIVVIATGISGTALALVLQLEPEKDAKQQQLTVYSAAQVIPKTLTDVIKTISNIDIHFANWDALLVKSMLIANAKVVFIFYVVMILLVFRGNGATVCTTSAYQATAISLSGLAFNKLNSYFVSFGNPKEVLEKSCLICAGCAIVMGFSQSYSLYLLTFIPFILSRTIIENYFVDLYEVRKNQKLGRDIETITAITEIICPFSIGLSFHMLKLNAYRILAVGPILVIYYLTKIKVINNKTKAYPDEKKTNEPVETNKDK